MVTIVNVYCSNVSLICLHRAYYIQLDVCTRLSIIEMCYAHFLSYYKNVDIILMGTYFDYLSAD